MRPVAYGSFFLFYLNLTICVFYLRFEVVSYFEKVLSPNKAQMTRIDIILIMQVYCPNPDWKLSSFEFHESKNNQITVYVLLVDKDKTTIRYQIDDRGGYSYHIIK
jgi:hypothetical protein